ncbi:MAG TPA: YkgJ family cysteine cluster protein [Polyangia bacterium]|nr:YkgJ family cysteine cluster protein [Polyangia bacterium]
MTGYERPWYRTGLRFECKACGACCITHGDCEYVFLADADVRAIAAHLGQAPADFLDSCCESAADSTWLKMPGAECVFLEGRARCLVYPVRPRQCADWPFWTENLIDERTWAGNVLAFCPGAGHGRLYPVREIERIACERDAWYGIDFQ